MIREDIQQPAQNSNKKANDYLDAEKVVASLRCKGVEVTVEQADEILKFLRKLANISVSNYLRKQPPSNQK